MHAASLCSVGSDEIGERLGSEQRRVGGEDEDVLGFVVLVVGEAGEPDGGGVAGAALDGLLDEFEGPVAGILDEALRHLVGAVADHDRHPLDRAVGEGVEHPHDHRLAHEDVQGLGALGLHPGAVSGGEHDGGQRATDGRLVHDSGLLHGCEHRNACPGSGGSGRHHYARRRQSRVVQLAERRPLEPDVGGSSPPPGARVVSHASGSPL